MSLQAPSTLLEFLIFLLPGFVAVAIFYSLTSHPKPDSFERAILALIFTFIVQAIVQVLVSFKEPTQQNSYDLVLLALVAIVVGVIATYCYNHDWPHRFFRILNITREDSYPSEWYSAFSQYKDFYVVIHLYDGRRLYGWPTEWPSKPAEGHFHLEDAEWMNESADSKNTKSVKSLLIPVTDVQIVEFVTQSN